MTRRKDVRLRIKHNAMRRLAKRPDNRAQFLLDMAKLDVFLVEATRRINALNAPARITNIEISGTFSV